MKLTKVELAPLPPPAIDAEAEDRRNELVQEAMRVTAIDSPDQNSLARNIAVEIRTHLKTVEAERVRLSKPLLEGQRLLKSLADSHVAPLSAELARLERLATGWLEKEKSRVAIEAKARTDLLREAKTDADFNIVLNEPKPESNRARGQSMKQVMKWEVTDIEALYHAKPSCVKLELRPAVIQQMCVPEMPTPGIKCWWENKATFSTR